MNQLDSIFVRLENVFKKAFKKEDLIIHPHTTAKDIKGWDSLQHIQLILAVEKEFNIKFKNTEIAKFQCVGDLYECIQKKDL